MSHPSRILVGSFLAAIAVGTLLLTLPISSAAGQSVGFLQAMFTATSAVCVTGLVVIDTGTAYSRTGQIVVLLLFQLGGLGLMLFSTSVLAALGRKLGLRERVLLHKTTPGVSLAEGGVLARQIVCFTLACEFIGFLVLWSAWNSRLGSEAPFYALFHSVSAFCNAGFSLWPDSLSQDVSNPLVNLCVILLIITGGLSFLVCRDLFLFLTRRTSRLSLHSRLVLGTSGLLLVVGTGLLWLFERDNAGTLGSLSPVGQLWASLFQSVTTRTAGFNTVPIDQLKPESLLLMMALMFVGGSPGSTAGGIKTTTLALLVVATWSQIRGRTEVVAHSRTISHQRVLQALALVMVAAAAVLSSAIVLNVLESAGFVEVLFETVSALATVGLSTGLTGDLNPLSQVLLCFLMFAGRVGPLTLVASLSSQTTRGPELRYPKEEILIG